MYRALKGPFVGGGGGAVGGGGGFDDDEDAMVGWCPGTIKI